MIDRRELFRDLVRSLGQSVAKKIPNIPPIPKHILNIQMTRNRFLGLTASMFIAAVACRTEQKELPKSEYVLVPEVTPTLTKAEVRNLLDELPQSSYKDFVMRYGYNLFQDNPPKTITLKGENISVSDVRAKDIQSEDIRIYGNASLRVLQETKAYFLREDHKFILLLPYIKGEKTDELPFSAQINYQANLSAFAEGIEPEITFVYPRNGNIPKSEIDNYQRVRHFILAKEAFTVAYLVAYIEETIRHMQIWNLPIRFNDGGQSVELLSQSLLVMGNRLGRFAAITDIAPFLLTAKALQSNKDIIEQMRKDSVNTKALNAITNLDFRSPEEMVRNTINFIINNKDSVQGVGRHVGNLDKLP